MFAVKGGYSSRNTWNVKLQATPNFQLHIIQNGTSFSNNIGMSIFLWSDYYGDVKITKNNWAFLYNHVQVYGITYVMQMQPQEFVPFV
jgi:hypothetical protein